MPLKTRLHALSILAMAGSLTLSIAASASDSSQQQRPQGMPPGPPPQAISACNGLASNAACSFAGRNNETVTGTCALPPGNGQGSLACRPSHPPHGMGANDNGAPPPNNSN
ncbi:MAG: hypothetical protein QM709_11695 [Spongiibacteraceae bacterium]